MKRPPKQRLRGLRHAGSAVSYPRAHCPLFTTQAIRRLSQLSMGYSHEDLARSEAPLE